MNASIRRYLSASFLGGFFVYVVAALLQGGWASAQVWLSPSVLMAASLTLLSSPALASAGIHMKKDIDSRLARLNYAFRMGLFFATFMLIISASTSSGSIFGAVVGGVIYGGLMGYFTRRIISEPFSAMAKNIFNINLPIPSNLFGKIVYYGLPILALAMILIGSHPLNLSENQWLRGITLSGSITIYYPFARQGERFWRNLLPWLPFFAGLLLLFLSKSV